MEGSALRNDDYDITITDPTGSHVERPSALQRWFLDRIRDPRDLPFATLAFWMVVTILPAAVLLFSPWARWWMAIPYVALVAPRFGPYTLMLHNTSHRRLFGRDHDALNKVIPWVLGPFMGQTLGTYASHHVGMHHPENNLDDDLSTTLPYQRDSVLGFAQYFASFLFFTGVALPRYHHARGRTKMFRAALWGESLTLGTYAVLLWWNPWPTLLVFVLPFLGSRFGMMAGNWGQHAFVDPDDPANPYRNSIVCINTPYNHACFNDGYHVGHHVKQTRHWTEMPQDFVDHLDTYRDHRAAVFEGVDHFGVWWLLMSNQWDKLVDAYVDLTGEMERDQIEAHLRARLVPATSSDDGALAEAT